MNQSVDETEMSQTILPKINQSTTTTQKYRNASAMAKRSHFVSLKVIVGPFSKRVFNNGGGSHNDAGGGQTEGELCGESRELAGVEDEEIVGVFEVKIIKK